MTFTQHAFERFIERTELRPDRVTRALTRFEKFLARAQFVGHKRDGREVWLSRGYVILAREGTAHTVFKPTRLEQKQFYYGVPTELRAILQKGKQV